MQLFDSYAVYLMVFSPLLAAVFITLIPTIDISSKRSISRFFAFISFLAYMRVFILFINNKLLTEYVISFNLTQFYINFSLHINKYNIFLFGACAATVLANMMLHDLNDVKSNAHQVAPFILTFILFITFGQKDLRVALPIISIANFIIYFLMCYSEKIRRGSTIFHMGTFLFSCDTLALILLQYQEINGSFLPISDFLKIAILIPGFSRICLPVFAPFLKNLFLNLDESEGPFIIIFLQLSGFFILILYRTEFAHNLTFISESTQIITLVSAFYIAFLALSESRTNLISYYFLVFYSSLASYIILNDKLLSFWHLSFALLLANIACFFHSTKTALMVSQYQHISSLHAKVRATWFLSLSLSAAIPGLGIGTALWYVAYVIILQKSMTISLASMWILALLLMTYALTTSARKEFFVRSEESVTIVDFRAPITKTFVIAPFLIAILTWFIPLITIYAFVRATR